MSQPLRTLILEDERTDAELMVRHLERAGFAPSWQRVATEDDFVAALRPDLDVILADYSLPQYDALRALARVRASGVEAPFLVVSANIGEELAVEAMRQGAADFVIKDHLARLGPAVAHALEQRRLLGEHRSTREALQRNEARARRILAAAEELTRVVPLYDRLSALARELAVTPGQADAVEAADAPVRDYLEAKTGQLLNAFNEFPAPGSPASAAETGPAERTPQLLAAMQDAIRVLEETKRSFKSRALGQLRERLEAVMRSPSPF